MVLVEEKGENKPILVMAADEGRFGRLGEVKSCWCPSGIRPVVPKQQVRQYIYAYTSVAPSEGKMTSLILPYSNTEMMNLFLKQVSGDFSNYLIIMQLDRASWHRSNSLKIPENIRLIFQPSYSPELMPVEHVWEWIRENYFYNQNFESLEKVIETLSRALMDLDSQPNILALMTNFPHLRVSSLNAT